MSDLIAVVITMPCLHACLYFLPHLESNFIKEISLVMEVWINFMFVPSSTRIYGVICVLLQGKANRNYVGI